MSDERPEPVDPPHPEAPTDETEPIPLELDDAPLADPARPGAIPNDMPDGGWRRPGALFPPPACAHRIAAWPPSGCGDP